jgi:hypothetical protein
MSIMDYIRTYRRERVELGIVPTSIDLTADQMGQLIEWYEEIWDFGGSTPPMFHSIADVIGSKIYGMRIMLKADVGDPT